MPRQCRSALSAPRHWRAIAVGFIVWFAAAPSPSAAADAPPAIVPGQFNVGAAGQFTYSIPIAVPPGTAGMVPALSLEYSTQNGDGLPGLGWALSGLPAISRCPRTLAQDHVHGGVNFDANDQFCFEGQRLIVVHGIYGHDGTEYRTEIDGFSRIISHGVAGTGPAWFEVRTKSGQIMEFGHTSDSQAPAILAPAQPGGGDTGGGGSGGGGAGGGGGNVKSITAPPGGTPVVLSTVRAWTVSKISDTRGNYLTVQYDAGAQNLLTGEVYPTEIDYTGNDAQHLATYNSVKFFYITRNDVTPVYQAGTVMENTQLLTHVKTYAGAAIVSDYRLFYQYASNAAEHNELSTVTLCDGDTAGSICLTATSFTWQGSRDLLTFAKVGNTLAQGHTQSKPNNFTADFNGDGLTDSVVLQNQNEACPSTAGSIFLGRPDGTFASANMTVTFNPAYAPGVPDDCSGNSTFYTGLTQLFDFDADGVTDILVEDHDDNAENQYYLLREDSPTHFATVNAGQRMYVNAAGGTALVGDFNGDGRADILDQLDQTDLQNSYALFSNGDGTFSKGPAIGFNVHDDDSFLTPGDFDGDGCTDLLVQNHDRMASNNIVYSCAPAVAVFPLPFGDFMADANHALTTGDFNGDGKTDVLLTAGASATLYLSTGTGLQEFDYPFAVDTTSMTIATGDFNGDGKTDLAFVPKSWSVQYPGVMIYLSQGTSFSPSVSIPVNSGDYDIRAIAADWNNDGASDLWVQNGNGGPDDAEALFNYVPELISAVSNGLGITTYVTYDRLNKNAPLYTKCPAAPPNTYVCGDAWPSQSIDGPLYVVSRIDSNNGLNGCTATNNSHCYSSTYAYAGAKADLSGRGFEGFSTIAITDVETGVVQTTNYATTFPYTGMVLSQTKVANSATLSSMTNSFTGSGGACGAMPSGPVYRVYLCQTIAQSWELGANGIQGPQLPTLQADYAGYDAYGNVGAVTVKTTPPGAGTPDAVKTTTNTWFNIVDGTHWLLGRLTEADVESTYTPTASDIVRRSAYTYDSGTGLLTSEAVEPTAADSSNLKITTSYQYDPFGNKTAVTVQGSGSPAPPVCTTTTTYDTRGQFPVQVTNCAGESETYTYDAAFSLAFGRAHSHTGPNGLTTSWTYDTFGRQTQELRADGTRTNVTYQYCSGINGGSDPNCPVRGAFSAYSYTLGSDGQTQIAPNTRTFYDGLSRTSAGDTQGFDGSWIRTSTLYDAFGRVQKSTRPYFLATPAQTPCATGSGTYCTTFYYDTLGRITKTVQPDGGYALMSYQALTTVSTLHVVRVDDTAVNEISTTVKNDLSQPASVTDPMGGTTSYTYDALGELLTVTDPLGRVLTTNRYDTRGRKICTSDADLGGGDCSGSPTDHSWKYVYDSLGRLVRQTDSKGQTSTLSYDVLGRMVARNELDMSSTWTYGASLAAHNIDKLVSESCTGPACGAGGASGSYSKTYLYDSLGRQSKLTTAVAGLSYFTTSGYDGISGKLVNTRAFSGFTLHYAFNTYGYSQEIDDGTNYALVYWRANARDAELHALQQVAGISPSNTNGLAINQSFDGATGRILSVNAGLAQAVASLFFKWDTAGDLGQRQDMLMPGGQVENFCYDALNRLKTSLLGSGIGTNCTGSSSVSYDLAGNITAKSDVGTYSYGSGAGPHALTSIATCQTCTVNGTQNPTFTYDTNGSMTGGAGRTATYTAANMTATVTSGSTAMALSYDPEHARSQQVTTTGSAVSTTIYFNDAGTNTMTERVFPATGAPIWKTYILADGKIVAQRTVRDSTVTLRYFVLDQLGSVASVADETGSLVTGGHQSYDAWGRMRNAGGSPDTTCSLPAQSQSTRGFTGHEEMPGVCLVNANARLYDPQLGRFLGADPTVEMVYFSQDLNRYSYVGNNPLSLSDPSGLCFLGCFWKSPLGRAAIEIVLVIVLQQYALPFVEAQIGVTVSSLANISIAGGVAGYVATGQITSALVASAEAFSFAAFGPTFSAGLGSAFGSPDIGAFVGNGMIGGMFSIGHKGGFLAGFMAAGFSSLGDTADFDTGDFTGNVLVHAALGGAGSVLGGGKFANGAVTGAFSYAARAVSSDVSDNGDMKLQGMPDSTGWPAMIKQGDTTQITKVVYDTLTYYGIDTSGVNSIIYKPNFPDDAASTKRGLIVLGPSAFRSLGYLGSTLAHEIEVHIHLQLQMGLWWTDRQGVALQEVQAYDRQLSPAQIARFGLSPSETSVLQGYRATNYNILSPANQARANAGDFSSHDK
jgi:RHS repeat-associated protein